MVSEVVSFELQIASSRRQLQMASATADSITRSLLPSVIASYLNAGIDASQVTIASTSTAGIYLVTILAFGSTTPSAVIDATSTPAFVTNLEQGTGMSIAVHSQPIISVRTTSVPSPPPATPPAPPSPPTSAPGTLAIGYASQNLESGATQGLTATSGSLSQEMIWVIIVAVLFFLLAVGCLAVYIMGKRSGRKDARVQVGRPALRRDRSKSEGASHHSHHDYDDEESGTPPLPRSPRSPRSEARVDDVRLIEIGMAVERGLQRQTSGASYDRNLDAEVGSHLGMTQTDLDVKLDGVQAAIENVRENVRAISPRNISPRETESPARRVRDALATSISTIDARIPKIDP